ncbi:isoleucine--tRNA ligase [Candidatus Pacearchaeota archaeon]|nr:isoleucine--tRNA ligase [Candidatus Pacearchaeota archaeon]
MINLNEIENEVLEFWKKQKIHDKIKSKNKKGKKFYFLQGPPYTSGKIHIGHAWNNSLKDLILRYKRMQGLNVWDRGGYDMHGLPTENAVQKKLRIKDKSEIEKYGVLKFVKECRKFSSDNAKQMDKDLERLGVWLDHKNAYWPIKNEYIEGEWWLIKKAWEQNRLYKGKKIMQWCGHCETSLAKHELEYKNVNDNSIFLKFLIKDKKDEYLVIWTTTPWTIPYNLAIMVNPDIDYVKVEVEIDGKKEKWIVAKALSNEFISDLLNYKFKVIDEFKGKKLLGTKYIHPFNKELKSVYDELKKESKNVHTVILSKEYVDTTAGSGLVHCAPGCGPEDHEVGKKYHINAFNELDEKGYFNDRMRDFSGLRAKENDSDFIKKLKDNGSLIIENKVTHEYAHCWRCHNPVIFRATEQWFMKIEDLISKMLGFNKKVKWQPKFTDKNFKLWIENLKDNGITRQRYWGCPAPIWQCECGETEVIGSSSELKSRGGKVPEDLHKPWIDEVTFKCKKCKKNMKRIPDVIDVWIDAGTASWNCLYYPKEKKYFDEFFPADLILEATEQIRLWYSMLQICSSIALNKNSYKNVYSHGMILDIQGTKMSKSLGNIISPYEIIDKYGADVLRYYMCETNAGENINFNWDELKIKQGYLNILFNVSKFFREMNKDTKPMKKLDLEEKYIISRKNQTIVKVTSLLEEYKLDEIIREIEKLFLDLSRIYIKSTRDKANSKESGKLLYAIKDVYIDSLKMFSIVCPFICEKIWQDLRNDGIVKEESVHLCSFPKADKKLIDKDLEKMFDVTLEIIEKGLYSRDKEHIGLKWPLSKAIVKAPIDVSPELKEFIGTQLNIKEIVLKNNKENVTITVDLETKMNDTLLGEGYSREISRKIQDARKKSGFIKSDFIKLGLVLDKEISKLIKKENLNFIKERVNCGKGKEIVIDNLNEKDYEHSFDYKIKGKEIQVFFSKI